MAASLPIVASDMPAHASIVAHGETGLLCNSPGELAAALDRLEIADANTAFGEAGRRRMPAKIGPWDDCAHRSPCSYQRLLPAQPGGCSRSTPPGYGLHRYPHCA